MKSRIALFVSLVTISGINAEDATPSVVTQGLCSKVFTTLTFPFVWTKDTALAGADFITNQTLARVTQTSYLQGGLLDNNKELIGRLAVLAVTVVAAQKTYAWYVAQQDANDDNADFIDFTYEVNEDEATNN